MSSDLTFQLRRLKKLNETCGGGSKQKDDTPEVDTSKMSPYEQQQYKIACDMKRTREYITELDGLGDGASVTKKTELSNTVRKELTSMKREVASLQKTALREKKREEHEQLVMHVKKTENLYRARFGGRVDESVPTSTYGATKLDTEMSELSKPMVNLREDSEFEMFFEQTKKNDVEIDHALDRIGMGVTRLHQNAQGIKGELMIQNELLDEADKKVENVSANLTGLNKKLKKTLKQVDNDKVCLYAFCLLLLLGLSGGIYYMITKNNKKDKKD